MNGYMYIYIQIHAYAYIHENTKEGNTSLFYYKIPVNDQLIIINEALFVVMVMDKAQPEVW